MMQHIDDDFLLNRDSVLLDSHHSLRALIVLVLALFGGLGAFSFMRQLRPVAMLAFWNVFIALVHLINPDVDMTCSISIKF
jgi:hypothetical protein